MKKTRLPWTRLERLAAALALALLMICPAFAAEAPEAEPAKQPAETSTESGGGLLTTLGAGGGTAVLIGAGAFTYVRKKVSEERKKKPQEFVYYENHTRNGTLV